MPDLVTADALRRAAEMLAPARRRAILAGGSNAQRDVISLTALEAALRARHWGLARLMADERVAAKPESPLARSLQARAGLAQAA
jgi:hypothetical protein